MYEKFISFHENGEIAHVIRWDSSIGKISHSCNDQPSEIYYYHDGGVLKEFWHNRGHLHRVGKPAVIEYYPDGSIMRTAYMVDSVLHRDDGPAIAKYKQGETEWYYREYHKNGVKITMDMFDGLEEGTPEFLFHLGML